MELPTGRNVNVVSRLGAALFQTMHALSCPNPMAKGDSRFFSISHTSKEGVNIISQVTRLNLTPAHSPYAERAIRCLYENNCGTYRDI
jgi:hypothetical protein